MAANTRAEFNYTPPGETLRQFMLCDKFFRGIRGPVGSGKSVCCSAAEIIHRSVQQKPGPDGIRRTRWAVVRNCYDDQTDVLTARGYVRFADLQDDDKVAVLELDGSMRYEVPSLITRFHVSEELYGYEGEGVDFLVNGEHDLWASKRQTRKQVWSDYRRVNVKEAYGTQNVWRVRRSARWHGKQTFTPEMWEFIGLFYAEGWARDTRPFCSTRFVLTAVHGLDTVRGVLNRAGVKYSEYLDKGAVRFRISSTWASEAGVRSILLAKGRATSLSAPDEIFDESGPCAAHFITGYVLGDGCENKGTVRISTASKQMADDLQRLAIHAGSSANVSFRHREPQGFSSIPTTEYVVTLFGAAKQQPKLFHQTAQPNRNRGWYRQQYDGELFCVTTSTGVINVRRNGKAFWCAQTNPQLKTTTIKTWLDWMPEHVWGKFNWSPPYTHRIQKGDLDIEVIFLALDRPEDIKKLLSLELTGGFINEAREVPKAIVDALTMRVGRFPSMKDGGPTWYGVWADTNAPEDDHWWPIMAGESPVPDYMTREEALTLVKPDDWQFFTQPPAMIEVRNEEGAVTGYKLNPERENRLNVTLEYYKKIITGKSRNWIDVYVLNRLGHTSDGKPVYPQYNDEKHVAKEPLKVNPLLPIYVGIDFGLTPAAVIGQRMPNGRWHILREIVAADMGISRFAPILRVELQRLAPGHREIKIFGDPAGDIRAQTDERTPFDILRAAGIIAYPAPSNDIALRLDAVESCHTRFIDGLPGYLMDPSCKVLRKGKRGGYHYKRVQVGGEAKYDDKPNKNKFSHVCDSEQYLLLGAGEGRKLTVGDRQSKPTIAERKFNVFDRAGGRRKKESVWKRRGGFE